MDLLPAAVPAFAPVSPALRSGHMLHRTPAAPGLERLPALPGMVDAPALPGMEDRPALLGMADPPEASDGRGQPDAPAAAATQPRAAPGAGSSAVMAPETLHPALWLGHQLGRHAEHAVPSGFAVLDAQLPGGGWPRRVLTELLLPHPGVGEIRLLAPSLAATQAAGRLVMLFDPPAALSAWALAQLGFDVEQLLVINTRARVIPGSDSLWALEQALKSGHVGALVAWLPLRLRAERLRRLQLAAHAHDGPAFVLRELAAQQRPSAAPLRLGLRAGGADVLSVRLLKRRGPPLETPLQLALPPVLSGVARQRARAGSQRGAPARMPVSGGASRQEQEAGLHAATFVNLG